MPIKLSSFLRASLPNPVASSASGTTNVKDAPIVQWNIIGEADQHLFKELEDLYWIGVEQEISSLLFAIKALQDTEYSNLELEDESDNFIHGFETFVDQVTAQGRKSAADTADFKDMIAKKEKLDYVGLLQRKAVHSLLDKESSDMKRAIRKNIKFDASESLRRRVKALLRAVGFLDIEKLVEHRPPVEGLSLWKRPAIPQLELSGFSKNYMPVFTAMICRSCNHAIRGSSFQRTIKKDTGTFTETICDNCYWEKHLADYDFVKSYKHCILNKVINPRIGRKICWCDTVPQYDGNGQSISMFPMSKKHKHRRAQRTGQVECGLLKLGHYVAEAKYDGMQSLLSSEKTAKQQPTQNNLAEQERRHEQEKTERPESSNGKQHKRKGSKGLRLISQKSLVNPLEKVSTTDTSVAAGEDEAKEDVPWFLRKFVDNYPFGNVHMGLRIGPLIIENGVSHTQGGALVTVRQPQYLHAGEAYTSHNCRALAISDEAPRTVWSQNRSRGKPKRYKAVMKQVVGVPFTGLLDEELENKITDKLIIASNSHFNDPGLSIKQQNDFLQKLTAPIIELMKDLLGSRITAYLKSIVTPLLDKSVRLKWSPINNNCQNFCDALLNTNIFRPLVSEIKDRQPDAPLYLLSFVCRPGSYAKPKIRSKYDVPRGLTEEYLLRFRYGRHDEADIVDTLQEYWYDWGAFNGQIYRYQDIFPWDCTEAFGRYPVACGTCNLAKHVWAFPFDSWSIVALHLTRDKYNYASSRAADADAEAKLGVGTVDGLSHSEWVKNRLLVLTAEEKLVAAGVGMVRSATFRAATGWLHAQPDPALDRLKLGGIHRAQPYSHAYEQGQYHHHFIASWAHLTREDQIEAYEILRDGKARLPDVEAVPAFYKNADPYKDRNIEDYDDSYDGTGFIDTAFAFSLLDTAPADTGGQANCGTGCGDPGCSEGADCGGGGDCGGGCGGCGGCGGD